MTRGGGGGGGGIGVLGARWCWLCGARPRRATRRHERSWLAKDYHAWSKGVEATVVEICVLLECATLRLKQFDFERTWED